MRRDLLLKVTKVVERSRINSDSGQTFQFCITGPSYATTAVSSSQTTIGDQGGDLTSGGPIPLVHCNFQMTTPLRGRIVRTTRSSYCADTKRARFTDFVDTATILSQHSTDPVC